MGWRGRKKRRERRMAFDSMVGLLVKADNNALQDPEDSKNMVRKALRLQRHYRLKLPQFMKNRICPRCRTIMKAGFSASYRTRSRREPHLQIRCYNCKHTLRIPLRPFKKGFKES